MSMCTSRWAARCTRCRGSYAPPARQICTPLMVTSSASGSKAATSSGTVPTWARIRPQLGSLPKIAALNRLDRVTARATARAAPVVAAFSTRAAMSCVAPSASSISARDRLAQACVSLSRALIDDAEGATHDIAARVLNAATTGAALAVARAVTRSNLFKAAIFGNDPNWGRILAQVGTVPEEVAAFDPDALDVTINGVQICRAGGAYEPRHLVHLAAQREVHIDIDLHAGDASATVWTNDLTHDYVHENSAYST